MIRLDYGDQSLELRSLTWPEQVNILEALVYAQLVRELQPFERAMATLHFLINTLSPQANLDPELTAQNLLLIRHYLYLFEGVSDA